MTESWHATLGGYNNHGCRLICCRAAKAAAMREYRKALRDGGYVPEHVHGSLNGYRNYGCRCRPCSKVGQAERRARYRRQGEHQKVGS